MSKTREWFKAVRDHLTENLVDSGSVDAVIISQRPPLTAIDSSIIKNTHERSAARATKAILLRRSAEEIVKKGGGAKRQLTLSSMDVLCLVQAGAPTEDGDVKTDEEVAFEVFDLSDLVQDLLESAPTNPLSSVYNVEINSITDFDDPLSKWFGTTINVGGRLLRV